MRHLLAPPLLALATAASADDAPAPWPVELTDPAVEADPPAPAADLMLPMPCGGAMAFQRVVVPVNVADPLDDRSFRMGQSEPETGFSDYLLPARLRGSFTDPESGVSFFYIARYELTVGQQRALMGDCDAPFDRKDRFATGELTWFDAIDLTRRYTEWLLANAKDDLPAEGDRTAFVRLPTEVEWEYAARGGSRIDPTLFPGRRFFTDGDLGDYAGYQTPGARGKLRPIGLRKPNPLGLYDIYGNAEELMLEPFRLNAIGRVHGQTGGIVTRGGSILSTEAQIYTAQRREYPTFDLRTGEALRGAYFGLRPVLGAPIVSDATYPAIHDGWIAGADASSGSEGQDPLVALARLLDEEIDPRRKEALGDLQLALRVARDEADDALEQAAKSTLLSGAAFIDRIRTTDDAVEQARSEARDLIQEAEIASGAQREQIIILANTTVARMEDLIRERDSGLLYFRGTLETLVEDVPEGLRERAEETLGQELAESGQARLQALLEAFRADVDAYRANPDMDQAALLDLALR